MSSSGYAASQISLRDIPSTSVFSLGFQVFNAATDEIIANDPTMSFLTRHAPNAPMARELEGFEAPMSNRKARALLGFRELHNWRKYAQSA
jgi:hypothetical protein